MAERPVFTVRSERDVFTATRNLLPSDMDELLCLSVSNTTSSSMLGWIESAWHIVQSRSLPSLRTITAHIALLAAFRNNNFDIGNNTQAVFRDICRINHSCVPNSQGNFNSAIGRFTIHSVRPIETGEEITISYLDEHAAIRTSRQGRLFHGYGFNCDCPACDLSTSAGHEGEDKRVHVRQRLRDFAENDSLEESSHDAKELRMLQELIVMFQSEGLFGRELATMYLTAAELSSKIGDRKTAEKYSSLGLDLEETCVGKDNPLYQETVRRMRSIRLA